MLSIKHARLCPDALFESAVPQTEESKGCRSELDLSLVKKLEKSSITENL